jgi:hypothetical protein
MFIKNLHNHRKYLFTKNEIRGGHNEGNNPKSGKDVVDEQLLNLWGLLELGKR